VAVTQQLILAAMVGLSAWASYFLLLFAAWRVRVLKHLIHDLTGTLTIVKIAREIGNEKGTDVGLGVLIALLKPCSSEVVKLRSLVKSVIGLFEVPPLCKLDWDLDGNIQVKVQPRSVHALVANLLTNAIEGAQAVPAETREPITVALDDERLVIRNVATKASREALRAGTTTKNGNGHGIGRRSIERCCQALNWTVETEIDGRFVVTTVSGFKAVKKGELENGESKEPD
jgi:hypothetical protein